MKHRKRIVFTVTNDLNYDQRMIRICTSLVKNGFDVLLVGRKNSNSLPLSTRPFQQYRLNGWFSKGPLFYIEYTIRLFFYLLNSKFDIICAIDLDTILPCLWVSSIKKKQRVYDAHELFCEMKEISSRPIIYKCWKWIEKYSVPKFKFGYTVNQPIADEFRKMYAVNYEIVRNMPPFDDSPLPQKAEKFLLYQGAVNEGRSFETLIPAMQWIDVPLVICGTGNFFEQAKKLALAYDVEEKVVFKGALLPEDLKNVTKQAWAGITLFDREGKSNYYSLANRFSDYIQAGIPQLCVDFPVYRELNNLHEVAVLIEDLSPAALAEALNRLINDEVLYRRLEKNCLEARKDFCWQEEEKKLIRFYQTHFA
jgi:glycosyltransferase involved in cell wall biosynthesis